MQKLIQQYKDYVPDAETQKRLNRPLEASNALEKGHEDFLRTLVAKVENGAIDPLNIRTLYTREVYEKMSEEDREKADLTAINLMSVIQQIAMLWKLEHQATFQIQNLVETAFQMKSRFEATHGNVYVI